jgi:hypothetical protein
MRHVLGMLSMKHAEELWIDLIITIARKCDKILRRPTNEYWNNKKTVILIKLCGTIVLYSELIRPIYDNDLSKQIFVHAFENTIQQS